MKTILTLLIVSLALIVSKAQTTEQNPQQDTLKKASHDVIVPQRVVKAVPAENKTLQLTDIQKIQQEKKQKQNEDNKSSRANNSKTAQDVRMLEQKKNQETREQPVNKPE